ncbi:MAG: hypothetical protein L0216_16485 [Planctomycetales bacterium]|nr:hypothetical protein [Planctomycetales bacterium]
MNGPRAASRGEEVAVAWFTAAGGPRVLAARSRDGGKSFGEPAVVSAGDPIGRADAAYLSDGSLLVSWLERVGDKAELRVRRLAPDGAISEPATAATVPDSRASGFPRLAALPGGGALLAWTDPARPSRVRTAVVE